MLMDMCTQNIRLGGQVQWLKLLIPALREAEEEDLYELKTSWACIWSSRIAWMTRRDSVSKIQRMVEMMMMVVVMLLVMGT